MLDKNTMSTYLDDHFKRGFRKTASPLLIDQTDNSAYTSNPHQEKRQAILEHAYRTKGKHPRPKKVVNEEGTRRQTTTINIDRE